MFKSSHPLRLVRNGQDESVASYLELWLSSRRSLRYSTLTSYEGHVRNHINPQIGLIPLNQLTYGDLVDMFNRLIDSDLRLGTLRRIHATLNVALNRAVRLGLIESNPLVLLELPPEVRLRPEPWTAKELAEFLNVTASDADHLLFALIGTRGLRRGEALGLRWMDVDLESMSIRIRQQLTTLHGEPHFSPPKSRAAQRTVALGSHLTDLLGRHQRAQQCQFAQHGLVWDESVLVFTTPDGRPRTPLDVTRHFLRIVELHGLRRIRLHDLRHGSASIGLETGETLLEVSRRLGHSSLALTADIYSDVTPASAAESARRFEDRLWKSR